MQFSEVIAKIQAKPSVQLPEKPVESDVKAGLADLILISGLLMLYGRLAVPQFFPKHIDKYLATPAIFSMVVIAQGLLGGLGLPLLPQRLKNLQKNPLARFTFISAIAYTATSDLELALVSTAVFACMMHILRTPEERKAVPYLV